MKTKSLVLSAILGIALSAVVLTGCKKNPLDSVLPPTSPSSTDISSAQEESDASNSINDTRQISDAAMQGNTGQYAPGRNLSVLLTSHCTIGWASDTNSADTLYINFGSTPVECNDGRWRQGEIIVYWTKGSGPYRAAYWDSGSVITMTFNNYASGNSSGNMVGVAGIRTLTNTGHNAISEENWKFSSNLTLTYSSSQTAKWNAVCSDSLVEVNGTYYYEINGNADGTSRKGDQYTLNIKSPLYVTARPSWWTPAGCPWVESGSISINLPNSVILTLDFGTVGKCSDSATAVIAGVHYPFAM